MPKNGMTLFADEQGRFFVKCDCGAQEYASADGDYQNFVYSWSVNSKAIGCCRACNSDDHVVNVDSSAHPGK